MEDFMETIFGGAADNLAATDTTTTTTTTTPATPIDPMMLIIGVVLMGGVLIYLFSKSK